MRVAGRWRTIARDAFDNSGIILGGLILVALILRLARLTFQPLWWDEGWSLYFATTDLGQMLELTAVDIHPPFYYLLLHFWIQLFGPGVVSVRLLSVLVGAAAVPLLYLTGRRLLGERGGLLAAGLLALSPFHIYYSQEVRMYGLVTLLGLVAFYFTLRWFSEHREIEIFRLPAPSGPQSAFCEQDIPRQRAQAASRALDCGPARAFDNITDWGVWLGYVLAATAALYTQYYAVFLLLALNLVVLVRWVRDRRPWRDLFPWLIAQLAVALLFAPWLGYAGGKLVTYVRFKVGVEEDLSFGLFTYLGRHLAAFDWGHAEGVLVSWWWLGLLPLALLVAALVWAGRKGIGESGNQEIRESAWGIGHWSLVILFVTLGCGFVVNLLLPFNPPRSERLLLLALPAYLLLFAGGLLTLGRYRRSLVALPLGAFVVVGVLSLAFFYTTPRYPDDDYRPLAARLRALALPGDVVVDVHPWQVGYFESYLPDDEARPALFLTPREVLPRERQLWADDPARMAADLDALLAEYGRLWFPDHRSMGRVLESQIKAYLVERAYPTLSEWQGENTVLSFFATGQPEDQAVTAQFGEWLTLDGAALDPGPLESGWGVAAVDLIWRVSDPPADEYTVGLRLVDGTGRVWAQRDSAPLGGLAPFPVWSVDEPRLDRHGLLIPAGTPPGDYWITLRVYRSKDMTVLPVAFEGGSGGEVTLGVVRVVRPDRAPPVEALSIEQPFQASFGHRLKLLGFEIHSDAPRRPGETVDVDLFWQALAAPGEDFLPRLQLLGDGGAALATLTEKPAAGTYPTAWWRAGDLVRDPHDLPLPASLPAGRYRLALSLVRAADGQPVASEKGETVLDLAPVEVRGRERHYAPPTPQYTQVASFGDSIELVGYDIAPLAQSAALTVTLHWRALATPDRNYHAFVHLLDAEGEIVAQHDGPPGEGAYPTLGWLPGEYLSDRRPIPLPADLPPGEYRLAAGLYDPRSGQRLGERLILDTPVSITNSQLTNVPICQNQGGTMSKLTIENVRENIVGLEAQVPLLDGSLRQYVNFDNAASTPALRPVFDKVNEFMTWYSSVHRGTGFKSQIATEAYELAHDIVGCFVGADLNTNTIIFGKNTTEATNKLARRLPLEPDDVVLCSLMEHHSNDLPWRLRARLIHVAVDDDGTLDEEDFDRLLGRHAGRVKLVAISGASNVTGCLNPIHRLAEKAHAAGAMILVDAAQLAPHRAIDMRPDDDSEHLDFVAISAHKMYAPYGTGALIGPISVFGVGTPDMVGGGTVDIVTVDDVRWAAPPDRDEAGSPNVVGAVALAQTILSLQEIGLEALARHEAELTAHALRRLAQIDGLELYGLTNPDRAAERVGVIPFNVRDVDHYKTAAVLSFEGAVAVRNGCFCAHPYILRLMKVSSEEALRHQQDILDGTRVGLPGLVRISFGCYNTVEEVDHAAEVLARIAAGDVQGEYEQDPASGAYWPRGYTPDYERYFVLQPGLELHLQGRKRPRCGV